MKPTKTIESFLQRVWGTEAQDHTHVTLYRGQPQDWPLLPKLFRPPNTVERVKKVELELLHRFKNESPYLLPSKPDNDWDWLSLGQHFRLPTRLLDWTANPLTALFFALDCDRPSAPVVYVYHATEKQLVTHEEKPESPFEIKQTRILKPSWHSLRVAMQAGWHTVHRIHEKKGRETFIPLTEMEYHEGRTSNIALDPGNVRRLRKELADMGIRHSTVYGDLQSVCNSIRSSLNVPE
jgi:hypothetical protein